MAMNIPNSRFWNIIEHEKEDIVQIVFMKLKQSGLRDFRGASKYEFLAYFNQIVRNT